ncbi:MAG: pyruvate dehydrogenase component, partial [Actinomycetota bacterium]|nr:pyruvate dehydrogenase component [Actinomycetota bacterium]
LINPGDVRRTPYVTQALMSTLGPIVAVSDWMRAVPDQISRWVPNQWTSLGTDGFGRSDTRASLRRHFHVDPESIAVAVLIELAHRGDVDASLPTQAVERYRLRDEQLPPEKDTTEGGAE